MVVDNELVVIIFRGIDRLLITIGGVISIWLGYKLFSKALPNDGTFDGGIGSWTVRMQNIAPGVFFALFGVCSLIFSISHPLSYDQKYNSGDETHINHIVSDDNKGYEQSQYESKFSGVNLEKIPNLDVASELDILNSLVVIHKYKDRPVGSLTNEQMQKINLSFNRLYSFQIYLINKLFGQGSFDKYLSISADIRDNPEKLKTLSKEDKLLYENIKMLYEQ